jgi:hypothetical protein
MALRCQIARNRMSARPAHFHAGDVWVGGRRHKDRRPILLRPLATFGKPELARHRVKDGAQLRCAMRAKTDANAEMRHAAREIGRAVHGVDDPQMGGRIAAALFAQNGVTGKGPSKFGTNEVFHGKIGFGQKVLRTFQRESPGGARRETSAGKIARLGGKATQEIRAGSKVKGHMH